MVTQLRTGKPQLCYTVKARAYLSDVDDSSIHSLSDLCKDDSIIHEQAIKNVKRLGGNLKDEAVVKGQYAIQFGKFKGKTFKWVLENALGYGAWLVDNMRNEKPSLAPLSLNIKEFKAYLTSFPEGLEA